MNNEFVTWHVLEALRAAKAEIEEDELVSRRLKAQTKLRFVNMSDDELWELANMAATPHRPAEFVYLDLLRDREHLAATTEEWMHDINIDNCSPCMAS